MNRLFDLLTRPFQAAPAWAMLVVSLVVGVLMLLLFKLSTNQRRLTAAKTRLMGHIYEMGLYQDELGVLFRIQGDLIRANFRYLSVTLPALLVLIIPLLLILAQLDSRFAHRPFRPGETTQVTATLAEGQRELLNDLTLITPAAIAIETAPVRNPLAGTATWRVRILERGRHELVLNAGGQERWTKQLDADGQLRRLASVRERAGWHHLFFNPTETPLPAGGAISRISLELPDRHTHYAGLRLHWLVAFCIFSLLFGLLLKDLFRVKI